MALEAVHLLGLALLGGATCIIASAAVRRTGLRGMPVASLARGLRPMFRFGLLLMAASGVMIVLAMPFKYYLNGAFRLKMLLLVAAIAATAWLLRMGDATLRRPGLQRALRVIVGAQFLWLGVGFCGRLIGFL